MKTILAKCLAPALLIGTLVPGTLLPQAAQAQRPFDRPAARGEMTWSGDVDDTVIVSVHGRDVRTRTVSGKSTNNVNTQVFGRLPDRPLAVFLRDRNGRGRIRIVQQPNPDNNFTASVRIHDPQSGRGHYNFTLAWRPLPPPGGRGDFGGADGNYRR